MSLYHAGQSKALWSHSRKQFVFIHGKKGRLQQGGDAEDTERAPQDSAVCVRGQSGGGEGRRGSSFWRTILTHIFQVFFFFFLEPLIFQRKIMPGLLSWSHSYYLMLTLNYLEDFTTTPGKQKRRLLESLSLCLSSDRLSISQDLFSMYWSTCNFHSFERWHFEVIAK